MNQIYLLSSPGSSIVVDSVVEYNAKASFNPNLPILTSIPFGSILPKMEIKAND